MRFIASPPFQRSVKKLHSNQKKELDAAIHSLGSNPRLGDAKRGDLSGVFVLKFKVGQLDWLLAYEIVDTEIILLLLVGPHENFYRDLKR